MHAVLSSTQSTIGPARSRDASFDVFRVLAILAVIIIHARPLWVPGQEDINIFAALINQVCRFAVPAFFTISGYFIAGKIIEKSFNYCVIFRQLYRLLTVFLFWSVVYLIFIPDWVERFSSNGLLKSIYWNFLSLAKDPLWLMYHGTRVHLWFLVTLVCVISVLLLMVKLVGTAALLPSMAFTLLMAILGGPYAWLAPWVAKTVSYFPVNFFMGMFFAAFGMWLFLRRPQAKPIYALLLALFGMSLHLAEIVMLYAWRGISPWIHDFTFGTVFWIIGITLLLLAMPNIGHGSSLANWGRFTLGVYGLHLVVQDALSAFPLEKLPYLDIYFPLIVYFVSLFVVMGLSKLEGVRKFVN